MRYVFILNHSDTANNLTIMHYAFLQYVGLQNLIERNKQLYGSGNAPSGGVALPFILVQVELSHIQRSSHVH